MLPPDQPLYGKGYTGKIKLKIWQFGDWKEVIIDDKLPILKGQLISKCSFGFIVLTKIPTEKFDKFCPRMGKAEFVKVFRWYFGRNDDIKRIF